MTVADDEDDVPAVVDLSGAARIISLEDEPQRSAFLSYRVAFRENEAEPNLPHAAALVRACNDLADVMGLDRV